MEILDHESQTRWGLDALIANIWEHSHLRPHNSAVAASQKHCNCISAARCPSVIDQDSVLPSHYCSCCRILRPERGDTGFPAAAAKYCHDDCNHVGNAIAEPCDVWDLKWAGGVRRDPDPNGEEFERSKHCAEKEGGKAPAPSSIISGEGECDGADEENSQLKDAEMMGGDESESGSGSDGEREALWLLKRLKEAEEMARRRMFSEGRKTRRRKEEVMEALEWYATVSGLIYLGVVNTTVLGCSNVAAPVVLAVEIAVFTLFLILLKLGYAGESDAASCHARELLNEAYIARDSLFSQIKCGGTASVDDAMRVIDKICPRIFIQGRKAQRRFSVVSFSNAAVPIVFVTGLTILITFSFLAILCTIHHCTTTTCTSN